MHCVYVSTVCLRVFVCVHVWRPARVFLFLQQLTLVCMCVCVCGRVYVHYAHIVRCSMMISEHGDTLVSVSQRAIWKIQIYILIMAR